MVKYLENFFVSKKFTHVIDVTTRPEEWEGIESVEYDLTFAQRIFVTMQYPYSSTLSTIILYLLGINIILNIAVYILGSVSEFNQQPTTCNRPVCNNTEYCLNAIVCAPEPLLTLKLVDAAGIVLFSVEYCVRMVTCCTVPPRLAEVSDNPATKMSILRKMFYYFCRFDSIVDLVSIAPFYFALAVSRDYGGLTCGFIRILRLPRLLHYVFMSSGSSAISALIMILFKSIKRSSNILLFTLFFYFIGTTLFATIIFVLEGGPFVVNADYPNGAYLRDNAAKNGLEPSLFLSIPIAVYFTVVTTSTLGYGDFTCQTIAGRAAACLLSFLGIIVLALPIAVIGTNFFEYYVIYLKKVENKMRHDEEVLVRRNVLFDAAAVNKVVLSIRHEDHCGGTCKTANHMAGIAANLAGCNGRTVDQLTVALEKLEKKLQNKYIVGEDFGNENSFGLGSNEVTLDISSKIENATLSSKNEKTKFTPYKNPATHPVGIDESWFLDEIGVLIAQDSEEKADLNYLGLQLVEAKPDNIPLPTPHSARTPHTPHTAHPPRTAHTPHTAHTAESSKSSISKMFPPATSTSWPWFVPCVYVRHSSPDDKDFPTVSALCSTV